ncbi:hypothetical protein M3C26_06910 [Kocuria rhizophila]|uniref:hypothetical protein n=1 Tax=Kocuria rhizophila TaxID=72000 RepID=UPI0021A5D85A|nr:hypothetical protein [Kocuria rhizophila]MCT1880520.1 hypothetical protein [Kocuria rhizophila]
MTRTIKASEIKPGMTIRWETQVEIKSTTECNGVGGVLISGDNRITEYLASDAKVTVLSEPQPEEPTAFGARVVADGMLFVRADDDANPWRHLRAAMWFNWRDVCALGEVTVIDADPSWTVPDDTPEVPERIEEWDTWEDVPEGVVVTVPGLFCHYRKNQGVVEFSDPDDDPDWTEPGVRTMPRDYGPWTRVSDV